MIYLAHIVRTGALVKDGLADNLLITFACDGPEDCLDYAIALDAVFFNPALPVITGDRVYIGTLSYLVSAVGEGVQQALGDLGHVTLVFDGATEARHLGVLHLIGETPRPSDLYGELMIMEARR
jgi:PTS system glucitol/sorbitol-specific IIA component